MSKDSSPDSNEPNTQNEQSRKGVVTLALLAGTLGLAVGAGLYAFYGQGGNGESDLASADAANKCTINETMRTALDKAAVGDVAAFKATDRPFSVADFKFADASGSTKSISDWKGRTVLLNLWATWCAPCRAEMPALDALQKELGGENFEVVPVSVDLGDPGKPKKFYKDIGLKSVGFFHDDSLDTLNTLKKNGLAFGLPATLLVDKRGCVSGVLNGPAEWAGEDAKKLIGTAL